MYGYIYIITNLINDKIYIGKRYTKEFDFKYWGSGNMIIRAIKKYGIENFTRDVLEWCETKEELDEKEKYYIKEYKSQDVNFGYNIADGGRGGFTGLRSKEAIEKIRLANIGRKKSEETKQKIANTLKGHKAWNKGLKVPEEIKLRISKKLKEHKLSEETKRKISLALTKYHKNKKLN